jgi:hypothetical protein
MLLRDRFSVNRGRVTAMVSLMALSLAWGAADGQAAALRTTCSAADFKGVALYGPKLLPNAGPLYPMLKGYRRFAGMSPAAYVAKWYMPGSGWRYPPQGGYLLTPAGVPITMQVTLFAGLQVDVFGRERHGTYLAPTGTPYAFRAIPPQTLDNKTNPKACNYLNFQVVKPFAVQSGPIAPGLGQPGFGYQYVLDPALIPNSPASLDIKYLTTNGYLKRVPPQTVSPG